ncbi:MAG: precorrin-6y C5,15-methyltransferase (decarboxylating) subunit CbiE [Pseudomonadota bacterium]
MPQPWLQVVGLGEDGMAGLSPAARALVESAEVIIGGARHHELSDKVTAERLSWPTPFDAMIETIRAQQGRRVVILVTGDPLWYSVGARILKAIDPAEVAFHPQLSAFQWAACRLGWSLADLDTLTAHGRPPEQVLSFLQPGARLLILTKDHTTPDDLARLLTDRGYGPSRLIALGALGGPNESRLEATAETWPGGAPDFHTLALECRLAPGAVALPRTGLPDEAFRHDGKMTKREARTLALSKLAPQRKGLLWDVGAGCGSIGVEWMRAARDAAAIAIEPRAERRALAAENALALGAPRLEIIEGEAPGALDGLPPPDAVFVGGGLSRETIAACRAALKPHGRLVAHAVTLEGEAVLIAAEAEFGGELTRIAIARAEPIGPYRGWRPMMPVTQWSLWT